MKTMNCPPTDVGISRFRHTFLFPWWQAWPGPCYTLQHTTFCQTTQTPSSSLLTGMIQPTRVLTCLSPHDLALETRIALSVCALGLQRWSGRLPFVRVSPYSQECLLRVSSRPSCGLFEERRTIRQRLPTTLDLLGWLGGRNVRNCLKQTVFVSDNIIFSTFSPALGRRVCCNPPLWIIQPSVSSASKGQLKWTVLGVDWK